MKISVIIPHFRGDAYIKDCLESLKAQEYHSFDENLPELDLPANVERRREVKIFLIVSVIF